MHNSELTEDEKSIDSILARLFISAYKTEERAIAITSVHDISMSELHVIRVIAYGEKMTMTQVAHNLKISVSALTIAMAKLDKKGYVMRVRDEDDRRVVRLELTEKGISAFEEHESFHKRFVESVLKKLEAGEKEVLTEALRKLEMFLSEEWENVTAKNNLAANGE